ncbi:LA2681 family HEPN domain-containing protein [Cohaesibacter celericrescens]|uniref:LA2681-like HEPN domain-containing protein n=1 Tax=Cohaesibacter celericrescens TaxID=2067669 RepID=A0A2N5XVI3_9HYPH|nr:LA2681 family HEPN domain-containing protein [Cohaesibacter celericrescens]PLW78504.1 hypothetical protein C0081_04215 [Cohaesibacter celericrescens]
MPDVEAFDYIGKLIDDSHDASFARGATRALYLLGELEKRPLAEKDAVLAEYFRANAWAARSHIANVRQSWAWECPEIQEEMLALSRATCHPGFAMLEKERRCQIITNRANLLNVVGRSIDAISGWDNALRIEPQFAMALGNRGSGLKHYAGMVFDDHQRAILALHAYDSLRSAIEPEAVYECVDPQPVIAQFKALADQLEGTLDVEAVRAILRLDEGKKCRSKTERTYRQWCLDTRLFLCPLNDLGSNLIAATDDLMLPGITEAFDERPGDSSPPPIIGFFSQMKQEYASARYMLFEGMNSSRFHFSDRDVTLTDTLDYPLYSLASERIRTAFRIAYSLLDKIAFWVDRYWKLGKVPERISFKNVWMVENKPRLLPQFENSNNWPLRGLYWLSKELFDDRLKQTTAADARELHAIRNALEHTYLRVSEGWAKPFMLGTPSANGFGIAIGSDELEAKAIRVMQIARSALFYVSFAIGHEERDKRLANPDHLVCSLPLHSLQDKRKHRDPH